MAFETFVALRYLRKRNMSRFLSFMTLVAVGSVAIGTAALIITFTILGGFERELRANIITVAAHIQVTTFRNVVMRDDAARMTALRGVRNVASAAPFLQREAIVVTLDEIDGVLVKGVETAQDVSQLRGRIVAGSYALGDADGLPAVVIGKRLADKLGLKLHDKLVLVGMNDLSTALDAPKVQCRIGGVYETGMAEYFDDVYIFTALPTAQRLFGAPGGINGYDVLCRSLDDAEGTADRIRAALGYPFDPRTVFAIYHPLFVWIDLQQELIPVVVGSLIIIAAFNIIATLLLFVIEKTSDIGILLALGASKRNIRAIFMYQGLAVGVLGAAIGSALAFVLCFAQQEWQFFRLPQDVYYMTTVPIHLTLWVFLVPSLAAIALTFVSSFVPAWLGARLNPVTSIRFH
ncbi:MAG: ABC transporter permease [Ignavibacteria bacterium]|nr:ABC transporter permease [Ignavibacteria bacterium]